jgi:large subunit ribosomal protein L10
MPREIKTLMLQELKAKFGDVPHTGCVLVDYQGVSADQLRRIRARVRERGAQMTVVKNSLFALAMQELGAGEIAGLLEGPVAVVDAENPVLSAKAVSDMLEDSEAIRVRGAYVEGRIVGPSRVEELAEIPGREALLSMLAGALMAPLRRLASGIMSGPRELLSVCDQLREQRGGQQEGTDQ